MDLGGSEIAVAERSFHRDENEARLLHLHDSNADSRSERKQGAPHGETEDRIVDGVQRETARLREVVAATVPIYPEHHQPLSQPWTACPEE